MHVWVTHPIYPGLGIVTSVGLYGIASPNCVKIRGTTACDEKWVAAMAFSRGSKSRHSSARNRGSMHCQVLYSYWTGKIRLDNSWFVSSVIQEKWFVYFAGIYIGLVIYLPFSFGHFLSKIGTSILGTNLLGTNICQLIFLMKRSPIHRARGIQCLKRNSHTNYCDYPWMFKSQAHRLFV